jgi:hypothetical protein
MAEPLAAAAWFPSCADLSRTKDSATVTRRDCSYTAIDTNTACLILSALVGILLLSPYIVVHWAEKGRKALEQNSGNDLGWLQRFISRAPATTGHLLHQTSLTTTHHHHSHHSHLRCHFPPTRPSPASLCRRGSTLSSLPLRPLLSPTTPPLSSPASVIVGYSIHKAFLRTGHAYRPHQTTDRRLVAAVSANKRQRERRAVLTVHPGPSTIRFARPIHPTTPQQSATRSRAQRKHARGQLQHPKRKQGVRQHHHRPL